MIFSKLSVAVALIVCSAI